MEQVQEERYVFQVEWFDKQADLIRNYLLTFYPGDNSIDMVSLAQSGLPPDFICLLAYLANGLVCSTI